MAKSKPMKASELMAKLHADPVWQKQHQERQANFKKQADMLRADEEPILSQLRHAGIDVGSLWDFVNSDNNHSSALSILYGNLDGNFQDRTKESLARALAVKEASIYWSGLMDRYQKIHADTGFKMGLAVALSAIAEERDLEQLAKELDEPANGESRLLLLSAFFDARCSFAERTLDRLKDDPFFAKEIRLRRRNR